MCICCSEIGEQTAKNVGLELTIIDWYDGPSSGVFECQKCHSFYRAFLIDWSPDHSERVFALSSFNSNVDVKALSDLLAQIRIVGDGKCQPVGSELLEEYGEPSIAVGWLNSTNRLCSCVRINAKQIEFAKTWLLFSDCTKSEYDWHSKLFPESHARMTEQSDEPKSR